jgi:hypothetical protein
MYEDNPEYVSSMSLFKLLYHNNPVKKEIAGSVKSVTETTVDDIMLCYNSFYVPSNLLTTKKPAEIGGQDNDILPCCACKVKWHGTQSFSKIRTGFFTWEMLLPAFHEGKVVVYCHQAMNLEEHEYA